MGFDEIVRRLRSLDTTSLCDAHKAIRAMDPGIHPRRRDLKLVGRAFTVRVRDDFLTVVKALRDALSGDVLVVDGQGGTKALAGELFATESRRKGLAGIVIDGAMRDTDGVATIELPVYARHVHPVSGTADTIGELQVPITCGGVRVDPGDVVFGDADGVVVASEAELRDCLPLAESIQRTEQRALAGINGGASLLTMLNFDDHYQAVQQGRETRLRFTL